MTEIPPKSQKMTKVSPMPKKGGKPHDYLYNTKIALQLNKKRPQCPHNHKNVQNTPNTEKKTNAPQKKKTKKKQKNKKKTKKKQKEKRKRKERLNYL